MSLNLPSEISRDSWMGGIRHKFLLLGQEAWIVEPPEPLKEKLYFHVPEWPDAFPERNGVKELLALGYYMIHIHVRNTFANEEALRRMKALYDFVQTLGFSPKGALIGMSLGGLFSFRYAARYPETVACIYADAPVCDLYYRKRQGRNDPEEISRAYGFGDQVEKLKDNAFSPVNNLQKLIQAKIPLLMILGLNDTVVYAEDNGLLLADRYKAAGGEVELITRNNWGHHPHGLDQPLGTIVRFILKHTWNKVGRVDQ